MGISSAAESREVEAWAVAYPEVAAEITAIQEGLESYAATHAIAPGAGVKEKLFATINKASVADTRNVIVKDMGTAAGAKIRSISPAWKYAAAASIVLLTGSMIFNYTFYNKYTTANKELSSTQELLAQEKDHISKIKHDMDIVHNRYSMAVGLKGMDKTPDATAKIFWMQDTHEVMIDASNLPDAPAGKQYQFWAIVDGTPVNGGMIITNDKGIKFHMQQMKSFGKAQFFAISLEKEGGNSKPTLVVSMGKII